MNKPCESFTEAELMTGIAKCVEYTRWIRDVERSMEADPEPPAVPEGTLAEVQQAEQVHGEWKARHEGRSDRRYDYIRLRAEVASKVGHRMPRDTRVRVTSLCVEWCAWTQYRNGSPVLHLCPWEERTDVLRWKHYDYPNQYTIPVTLVEMNMGDFNQLMRNQLQGSETVPA
jgi:hypothetical protein